MSNLAIVILAAGASSRMGQPKQLLLFRGKTLVQHAVDISIDTGCSNIYLVVNPLGKLAIDHSLKQTSAEFQAEAYAQIANRNFIDKITILVNESYANGISTSIRLATTVASAIPEIKGLLFLNSDQPLLTAEELLQLMASYSQGKIRDYDTFLRGVWADWLFGKAGSRVQSFSAN
jgi:molybdenum cofactor cytidylyltransferase